MGGFQRLFVANRGEVAARVARTCDRLGVTPVFGVSSADADAPWVRDREKVVLGPPRASESYLRLDRVVQAALQTGCTALHPGWGFLSESPTFAALCETHGVTFVGPPAHVMQLMGRKSPAKRAMARAGLAVIPGSDGVLEDAAAARRVADAVGYPVLLKAEAGGGGRGMRIARAPDEVEAAFDDARAEAAAAFGDDRIYLERLVQRGRHVEVQLMADRYGQVAALGERDCTVQRNHQKLVEESPSGRVSSELRAEVLEQAAAAARAIGYVGAGTLEMLLDEQGVLRFMEMNTRLQVEHTVTEMRSGIDLVQAQLEAAAGVPSTLEPFPELSGHAIECRINAEDPEDGFKPSPGKIERFELPEGEGVRVDTHAEAGYVVPPYYDSLIAKLIVHAPTRDAAIDKMVDALERFHVEGVATTIAMHLSVLRSETFRADTHDSTAIPGWSKEVR